MGIADQPASQPTQNATSVRALLLATFTAAITLSAALLLWLLMMVVISEIELSSIIPI